MGNRFRNFMSGRYGMDQFGRFLSFVNIILLIISIFAFRWLFWVALALIAYQYFRVFSRNVYKRYAENQKFLNFVYRIKNSFNKKVQRAKDKEHCYFKCPNCKRTLRVPRGKGTISIHCPHCDNDFVKRT